MAKSNSIIDLRGTYVGITFVQSRANGNHIRAAWGTYKEAKVNEAFKNSGKKLVKANRPANIFKDARNRSNTYRKKLNRLLTESVKIIIDFPQIGKLTDDYRWHLRSRIP